MRKAYVQVDKQGNIISPAMSLPLTYKGQDKFDQLTDAQLAKYGWHKTNLDAFQGQLGRFEFDSNFNVILNDKIIDMFVKRYYDGMKSAVWEAIAGGVKYLGYSYKYSYHHQMQTQNACLVGGKITRYLDGKKESFFHSTEEAKNLLRVQMDNVDFLKDEYNFYCNKLKTQCKKPEDFSDFYREFKSAIKNERS